MKHGHSGYTWHKCRCEICTRAQREYMRLYKAKDNKCPRCGTLKKARHVLCVSCRKELRKHNKALDLEVVRTVTQRRTQEEINASKGNHNGWDLEVVYTEELAPIVNEWANRSRIKIADPIEALALRIEMDVAQLRRIIDRRYKHTSLILADRILVAIGRSEALSNGEIQVIPNPRYSEQKWLVKMAERGVI